MLTTPTSDLRKAYKTTVIIGLAMMASLLVYLIVVESIKKQHDPFGGFSPMPEAIATLRYALLGVAVMEFFLIQLLNKLMLSAKAPIQKTPGNGQFGPEVQKLMSAAIVIFALCESVAIYGLVLFLIQGNSNDFYIFLLISLFYFSIFFPKYSAWEAWVKEREKAAR
jgi:F0F1-type ATP synthase membrane subunit c/vacuolar-type H+-ATPase subunit K